MNIQTVNKITLGITPFFACSKFLAAIFMFVVWKYVLNGASDDSSVTPDILLQEIGQAITSLYFLCILLLYCGSYFLYKKQQYIISIALLALTVVVGVVFSPLVL